MSYRVDHVRVTAECDACGNVEKHDFDKDPGPLIGWSSVTISTGRTAFCCAGCTEQVDAILCRREREAAAARAAAVAACKHHYEQRGFFQYCKHCGELRR